MSNQFDWEIGDLEEEKEEAVIVSHRRWWLIDYFWFLLATAVLIGLLIGGWRVGQAQLDRSEKRLMERVQTVLDLERQAFLDGDGELYFSIQAADPAWISAQLHPENQEPVQAGLQVTRARAQDEIIWANASWTTERQTWQRILFFEWRDGHPVHVQNDSNYWGKTQRSKYGWGELVYHEIDEPWAETIANFVTKLTIEICVSGNCIFDPLPFTLEIRSDYAKTAAPDQINIPSPRLLALTEDGRPAPPFWRLLKEKIEDHLTHAIIRFAVPPNRIQDGQTLMDYRQIANRFMSENPDITVELIFLDEFPDDPTVLAAEYDGASIPPTEEMLKAGLVLDLTDYVNTDPGFDQADFYEQIWQGASWQDRTWFMPQAAGMRVLYYDKQAYELANLPEPSLRWTWNEMASDLEAILAVLPDSSNLTWSFLDSGLDSFLSYAYNWNNHCTKSATVLCQNPLKSENLQAAFEWYKQMINQPGKMPDVTQLSPEELHTFFLSNQGARRKAAVWIDRPVSYEHHLLLSSMGIVPFPGSDRFDGITPLWVQGGFISQQSDRPLAVWRWLKYLSYQRPPPRLVPARPSVAEATFYWTGLPRPLGDVMRTAFPFARPVSISEQSYLWGRLAAVIAGELSPAEASQQPTEIKWFQ